MPAARPQKTYTANDERRARKPASARRRPD